ncbi:MAG: hypothetical protein FIB02_01300 [Desulfuromonas sp.]|nr:hypothetical protein [Desulfuromonas sp.]
MKKLLSLAVLISAVAVATPALADDGRPYRHQDRERAANHFERQGDRIDARLDRQGERIERSFDRRAARAEAHGRERQADYLRAKGERIARYLDREGDRIEARLERRGERFERHLEHRERPRDTYRHDHVVYAPVHRDRWCGDRFALQLNGLGIFWSHRH